MFDFSIDEVNAAIVRFQKEVTDKKATILPTYNSIADVVRGSILTFTTDASDTPST
jgi:hypothetical protein